MKRGLLLVAFLISFLLILVIASAQNQTIDEKAYDCLKGKVDDECDKLTLEEQVFSLLALADNSNIQSECESALKSRGDECFPKTNCKIKDTALALLSLSYIKDNTNKIEDWLLSKNTTPTELEWYLEIESSQATQCNIKYDSASKTINIAENKKVSGSLGDCLELAYDNYWLKIKNNCLKKKFEISCDKDFISTLLYKKSGSNVWHISSDTKSASSGGKTYHEINSYCFGLTNCDYEGSLWASLALRQAGKDISSFMPYIIALSEDYPRLFPETFLLIQTDAEEYLKEILSSQKDQGFWKLGDNERYDTALALLALPDSEAETNAKSWLEQVQGDDGCWNNKRDTGFLLWAGFPRTPRTVSGTSEADCRGVGYCMSIEACNLAGGDENKLKDFDCPGINICCDKQEKLETCREMGGEECSSGEECDKGEVPASDTENCCLGTCEEEITLPGCSSAELQSCKSSCEDNEETISDYECPAGKVCCKSQEKPGISWIIWILIILIILVILGIIFRNKLKLFLFKMKSGYKKSGVTVTRPSFPPTPPGLMRPRVMPRPIPQLTRQPIRKPAPITKPQSKTDKELEETLKKLKEMSE